MQKDSENKGNVINHFLQIIQTTQKKYQIGVNKTLKKNKRINKIY